MPDYFRPYKQFPTTNLFKTLPERDYFGEPNGIATLDADGKLTVSQIPANLNTNYTVESIAELTTLSAANIGDTAIITNQASVNYGDIYILTKEPPSITTNWKLFAAVTTVNGKTGPNVVLDKSDVGLANVDNTSDLNKPISTATQAALDLKANQSTTYTKTEVDTIANTKQDTLIAGSNINISDNTISTMSGEVTATAQTLVRGETVYAYIPRLASTSSVVVTPTAVHEATAISSSAVSGYITVIPSQNNIGAVYIDASDIYNNANPIYPDPGFNTRFQYPNLSLVKLFVDAVGDSATCVIEQNNI